MAAGFDRVADDDAFRDAFADFERGVLQDNIMLCDQKSGILLAFSAAMVLVCLQGLGAAPKEAGQWLTLAIRAGFVVGTIAFLVSCYFALATVTPRIRKGPDDHILWESSVFKLPVDDYVARFREMNVELERENRLRYLHTLAAICRTKFRRFAQAMQFGMAGFIALLAAELVLALS